MRILNPQTKFSVCAGERQIVGQTLLCPLRSSCTAYHHYIKAGLGLLTAGRMAEYRPDLGDEFCHYPDDYPQT